MNDEMYGKMARYYEALFEYVGQPEIFEDYCRHLIDEDLDVGEYVQRYRSTEFRAFAEKEFPDAYQKIM